MPPKAVTPPPPPRFASCNNDEILQALTQSNVPLPVINCLKESITASSSPLKQLATLLDPSNSNSSTPLEQLLPGELLTASGVKKPHLKSFDTLRRKLLQEEAAGGSGGSGGAAPAASGNTIASSSANSSNASRRPAAAASGGGGSGGAAPAASSSGAAPAASSGPSTSSSSSRGSGAAAAAAASASAAAAASSPPPPPPAAASPPSGPRTLRQQKDEIELAMDTWRLAFRAAHNETEPTVLNKLQCTKMCDLMKEFRNILDAEIAAAKSGKTAEEILVDAKAVVEDSSDDDDDDASTVAPREETSSAAILYVRDTFARDLSNLFETDIIPSKGWEALTEKQLVTEMQNNAEELWRKARNCVPDTEELEAEIVFGLETALAMQGQAMGQMSLALLETCELETCFYAIFTPSVLQRVVQVALEHISQEMEEEAAAREREEEERERREAAAEDDDADDAASNTNNNSNRRRATTGGGGAAAAARSGNVQKKKISVKAGQARSAGSAAGGGENDDDETMSRVFQQIAQRQIITAEAVARARIVEAETEERAPLRHEQTAKQKQWRAETQRQAAYRQTEQRKKQQEEEAAKKKAAREAEEEKKRQLEEQLQKLEKKCVVAGCGRVLARGDFAPREWTSKLKCSGCVADEQRAAAAALDERKISEAAAKKKAQDDAIAAEEKRRRKTAGAPEETGKRAPEEHAKDDAMIAAQEFWMRAGLAVIVFVIIYFGFPDTVAEYGLVYIPVILGMAGLCFFLVNLWDWMAWKTRVANKKRGRRSH